MFSFNFLYETLEDFYVYFIYCETFESSFHVMLMQIGLECQISVEELVFEVQQTFQQVVVV